MILEEMTSPAMQHRLSTLIALRPDVETISYILGRERLLEWAHTVGISMDHELRDFVPPIPPQNLRSIVAAPAEAVFLWSGLKDAEICAAHLDRYVQTTPGTRAKVLDFGCGCGRTTRFLQSVDRFEVHGSDVNSHLTKWCQDNLKDVTTSLNDVLPPLPFEDGKFDFIYSVSIFSHLSENSMQAWLDELGRIAADNSVVMLTTHGYPAINTICHSELHRQMFRLTTSEAEVLRAGFADQQFVYFPYDTDVITAANAGKDYGNTFIHEAYIRNRWGSGPFEVVDFIPGGLRGWQDITILRRRARA